MPWKNGLGSTTELAVEPLGASLDGFNWRASIAELRGSGPFSQFAGYERIIMQLDGPPMELAHDGRAPVTLQLHVPHSFAGDDHTTCVVGGIAHDFNLIVRPDKARAVLAVRTLLDGETLTCEPDPATLLHVLVGGLQVSDGATLGLGDTRIVEAGEKCTYRADANALVLIASLFPPR